MPAVKRNRGHSRMSKKVKHYQTGPNCDRTLVVDALINERRDSIYHAEMMDPHTAAELNLGQIWQLVDKLIEVYGQWLPSWIN